MLFTVGGSSIFFSVSAEMKHPEGFTRALLRGHIFIGVVGIATSSTVYAKVVQYLASPALGSAGPLSKKICYGIMLPGLIITGVLFSHAAAKYWFVKILPGTRYLQSNAVAHWFVWSGSMLLTVGFRLVMIGLVPSFDDFMSLIGALINPILINIVPGFMVPYFLVRRPATVIDGGPLREEETGRPWLVYSMRAYTRGWKEAAGMSVA